MITYSDPTLGVGSAATHTCNKWFPLIGSPTRTCSSSNNWSGSAPHCRGMCVIYSSSLHKSINYCIVAFCRDVTQELATADIYIFYDGGSVNDRPVCTVATYSCNTGYTPSNGDSVRTCQDDGTWSGSAPSTCQSNHLCIPYFFYAWPKYYMYSYTSLCYLEWW